MLFRSHWWRRREVPAASGAGTASGPCGPLARCAGEGAHALRQAPRPAGSIPRRALRKRAPTCVDALSKSLVETKGSPRRLRRRDRFGALRAPRALRRRRRSRASPGSAPCGFDSPEGSTKKSTYLRRCSFEVIGGDEGNRTLGLCHATAALSQLSYVPKTSDYDSRLAPGVNGKVDGKKPAPHFTIMNPPLQGGCPHRSLQRP